MIPSFEIFQLSHIHRYEESKITSQPKLIVEGSFCDLCSSKHWIMTIMIGLSKIVILIILSLVYEITECKRKAMERLECNKDICKKYCKPQNNDLGNIILLRLWTLTSK